MFKTLGAMISPKSFKLDKFLAGCKRYQRLNSTLKKRIAEQVIEQPADYYRNGQQATATFCGKSIVTITDDELARALYATVNTDGFWERIENLSESNGILLFNGLKFLVDEKQQKVMYISYTSFQNFSQEFFSYIFEKLNLTKEALSNDNFKISIDYEKFFLYYLREQTSFLTSFFISIVPEEYGFTPERLVKIAGYLLTQGVLPGETPQPLTQKGVKGIYVHTIEKYFNNCLPRSLCINILRLNNNINAFSCYSDFFSKYEVPDTTKPNGFDLTVNYVFDEELLISQLNKCEETDEFITYSRKKAKTQYVVMKLKDVSYRHKYLSLIRTFIYNGFIESAFVAPNSDFTAYYLFFEHDWKMQLLSDAIALGDDHKLEELIRFVVSKNWCIPIKPNTDLVACFTTNSSGHLLLLPTWFSKIDFNCQCAPDYRLFILQMIKAFVESKAINADKLFAYSFMKLLPYTFAARTLEYIKTGTYTENSSESWGNVLKSKNTSKIKFLSELRNSDADFVSFIPTAHSLGKVQELIRMRSPQAAQSFSSSADAFTDYNTLSDSILSGMFDYCNDDFVSVSNIIVTPDMLSNNEYVVIGVTWNLSCLRSISDVISGGIDSKQLYTMICSLATKRYLYVEHLSSTKNLGQFLVDKDFNVFVNPNILARRGNYKQITHKHRYQKAYYNKVVSAFHQIIDQATWNSLDHFDYEDLLHDMFDLTTVQSLQLCSDHNHYHLPNELCPECKKICEITDNLTCNRYPHLCAGIDFFEGKNNNFTFASSDYSRTQQNMLREVKIGLENNLYDGLFFKPLKLSVYKGKVNGILLEKISFDELLPLSTFKNIQRLKVVLILYKNLLPRISAGSFITEAPRMFTSIAMHKAHPGQIIIQMLPLMECSSVMMADIESKENKIHKTKQLFSKFLVDYITEDESLKRVENSSIKQLLEDIKSLSFSEEAVMNCLGTTCAVHQVPLLPNRRLCPICLSNGITEEIVEVKPMNYFQQLEKRETTYEGGEANLYPNGNGEILKLFKDNVDLVHKSKVIGKAISYAGKLNEFNKAHPDIQFVTINKVQFAISGQGIKLEGYLLNLINDSFKISRLKDKEFVESKGYTRSDIINILIKVCIGIEFLHSLGIYIGDLNGGNILIKDKAVYFIDIDGMSFGDVKNFIYTDTYIYPPSAANQNITMDDDWYSLAIQAFYYLTYSHPFRGVCNNSRIPTNVVERMTKGYSVLGTAGIIPPSISSGWDFMPDYLITFFRQTFEGNRRESMRNVLEAFLGEITAKAVSTNGFAKVTRLSPCNFAISENIYLSRANSLVWKENVIVPDGSNYTLVKSCGDCFIFQTDSSTIVINDKTGKVLTFSKTADTKKIFALKNRLFYVSDDSMTLSVKKISDSTGQETLQNVSRATNNKIVDFFVTDSLKFIFLEEEDESHYAIYCNLQKLTSVDISQLPKDNIATYILYDELSGKYLVLLCGNGMTISVVINPDGTHCTSTLQLEISKSNCYYGNTLYYVTNGKIEFYRLTAQKSDHITLKFATKDSLIYHEGSKFVICNNNSTYVCLKP